MADELDMASAITTLEADRQIARARAAATKPGPVAIGACYFCDEELPRPRLYCDSDCARQHAKSKEKGRR